MKRKVVEQRGERDFIDRESGGRPVHAPCTLPNAADAKPGGCKHHA